MIVDSLNNIELYQDFPFGLFQALKFLKTVNSGIELGSYEISDNSFAIVSEYATVERFERGYEAHRNVIDVQYPVTGTERIKWSPLKGMDEISQYDVEKDRTFYNNPSPLGADIDIGNGIFAVMFPNDAHSPQHYIAGPELIKKITVKISI